MEKLPILIVACACVTIVGAFLPINSGSPQTLWDLHGDLNVYWIYAGMLAALVGGVAAAIKPPFRRWQVMLATYGFVVIGLKFRMQFFDLFTGGIGGQLTAIATTIGAITSGFLLYRSSKPATS